jgi:hypothetical protein
MLVTKEMLIKPHARFNKKLRALGVPFIDGHFVVPIELFLEHYPLSRSYNLTYHCTLCNQTFTIAVGDWSSKKNKDYCGECTKKHILVGTRSSAFGNTYTKGVPKSEEHKAKLRGPRKSIRGENNPKWNANTPEFKRYKNLVVNLTKQTYSENIKILNPDNRPRTRCGVEGGWQLDHKKSIKQCFLEGLSPEQAASVDNLQMLPWKENLSKSSLPFEGPKNSASSQNE